MLTWCNGNKSLLQTLQQAAKKFIRLIFKLNYCKSVKNTMQQNHILIINQLFEIELACFMYRYDHGKLPLACQILLKNNFKSSKTKLHQTRSYSKYFSAYCRINLTMQSIKYKRPVLWNKIPSSIREVKSLVTFKLLQQDFLEKMISYITLSMPYVLTLYYFLTLSLSA